METPEGIPNPVVKIDNQTDRYHTVVSIQFGDRLGELLDTVNRFRLDALMHFKTFARSAADIVLRD